MDVIFVLPTSQIFINVFEIFAVTKKATYSFFGESHLDNQSNHFVRKKVAQQLFVGDNRKNISTALLKKWMKIQ